MDKTSIFNKTRGYCHICGEKLKLENYGKKFKGDENWTFDHVLPKSLKGEYVSDNFLPAHGHCNRLRWNRTGENLIKVFDYGIIALQEVKKNNKLGKKLKERYAKIKASNQKRRK